VSRNSQPTASLSYNDEVSSLIPRPHTWFESQARASKPPFLPFQKVKMHFNGNNWICKIWALMDCKIARVDTIASSKSGQYIASTGCSWCKSAVIPPWSCWWHIKYCITSSTCKLHYFLHLRLNMCLASQQWTDSDICNYSLILWSKMDTHRVEIWSFLIH